MTFSVLVSTSASASIADTVSQRVTRRQILDLYLNKIFHGNTAHGP